MTGTQASSSRPAVRRGASQQMRRGTLVLASSLTAAAAAGAPFYSRLSQRPSSTVETSRTSTETELQRPPSLTDVTEDVSAGAPQGAAVVPDERPPSAPLDERNTRRRAPVDEATARERSKKLALDAVRVGYTLLFEDL